MKAVFNSSPLIFLSKLKFLDKALELFGTVYIPLGVIDEIDKRKDKLKWELLKVFAREKVFKIGAKNKRLLNALNKILGRGEAEAIIIALENQDIDYVILDDYVARRTALRLGLKPKGTLAIIKKLLETNRIEIKDREDFYEKLREIKFRIKREIFDEIFK